jgi:hypothetical protein
MKTYALILILWAGWTCKSEAGSKSVRLAEDVSVQSEAKISIHVPPHLEGKKLQVQLSKLTAEKPPETLFELSLRCDSNKTGYHLGYINFFNAVRGLGQEPTFTFDLPDLARISCPSESLYLMIEPSEAVAPDSFPRIGCVSIRKNGGVTSKR